MTLGEATRKAFARLTITEVVIAGFVLWIFLRSCDDRVVRRMDCRCDSDSTMRCTEWP